MGGMGWGYGVYVWGVGDVERDMYGGICMGNDICMEGHVYGGRGCGGGMKWSVYGWVPKGMYVCFV